MRNGGKFEIPSSCHSDCDCDTLKFIKTALKRQERFLAGYTLNCRLNLKFAIKVSIAAAMENLHFWFVDGAV